MRSLGTSKTCMAREAPVPILALAGGTDGSSFDVRFGSYEGFAFSTYVRRGDTVTYFKRSLTADRQAECW